MNVHFVQRVLDGGVGSNFACLTISGPIALPLLYGLLHISVSVCVCFHLVLFELLALDHTARLLLVVVVLLNYLVDEGFVGMHAPPCNRQRLHRLHLVHVLVDYVYFLEALNVEALLQELLCLGVSTCHELARFDILAYSVC